MIWDFSKGRSFGENLLRIVEKFKEIGYKEDLSLEWGNKHSGVRSVFEKDYD
jgi:hypothetical protein